MRKRSFVNPVIGDRAVLVKSSEETNGAYTELDIYLMPGGSNLLHFHDSFSETFAVKEGELTIQVGLNEKKLKAGEQFTVKPHQLHCFKNKTNEAVKFKVTLSPGHTGFEKSIAINYGLASDGETNEKSIPNKFSHLSILVAKSGTIPAGFWKFLMPVFRWVAGRQRETELELEKRYC
jgi:quercetin dioxygenase-like cupin family protein